jgi:hypothetical protein
VDEHAAWLDALHVFNRHAVARLRRDWDSLPPAVPPSEEDGRSLAHHPYATDLDLFGRASLAQWLGPSATPAGARTLRVWLLHPASPSQVAQRQQAVAALAPATEWREQLGAHGRLAADVRPAELDRFVSWSEGPGPWPPARLRVLRGVVLPLTAGVVLSFATAPQIYGQFDRAGAGQQAFARYAGLFAHAVAAPGDAPHLRAIHGVLAAEGMPAPACMARLNRIIGFAQLRSGAGILHFIIQALTLWDLHVFFALDRWRRRAGPAVRGWMSALGELDALSAFAQVAFDNPSWVLPQLDPAAASLDGQQIGHPLIPDDRRVANDVTVGPPGTLLLITGSNMSGKSTLLRAIGLNTVLAQAGAPVCAAWMRLPPVDLETSIRVQDSLEQGLSYFMAALARLKALVDRARRPDAAHGSRMVLYLLDEVLQGTNTAERSIAVRGIARHLLDAGAIGVMTTHDLAIAGEAPLDRAAHLAHFSETVDDDGGMTFDYRLRPGLATSRNALRLMRAIGLELPD